MSYGYSILFTKDGKFMGEWDVGDQFTRDDIEYLKKYNLFKDEYDSYSGYTVFEVDLSVNIDLIDDIDRDIYIGFKHAIKEQLRMFLG